MTDRAALTLSPTQARKLVLLSQGFPVKSSKNTANSASLAVIERLGYVQIDTISVVQRAHHHTLWTRNPHYQLDHIDTLIADKKVFEYWSHAAAYLPMQDYRFSLPRKNALKAGEQQHWFNKNLPLMAEVMSRIEAEGPLMAKDFVSKGLKNNGWGASPTKQALENLYMQGDLMITERRNFHKVYDLTQRVLPKNIDDSVPTAQEHGRFLVLRFLRAQGFGTLAEIIYLLKHVKAHASAAIDELYHSGEIDKVLINGVEYYACHDVLALLNRRVNKQQLKILSPFDNLLIQRKRANAIFDFDYLLECYVPAAKRQFGYFCLPIMWNATLVARADCKAEKRTGTLYVIHLILEPSIKELSEFMTELESQLQEFAHFNMCERYIIQKVSKIS
ncbi:winged helix-turn-helix domain-containing protein [Shewanella sp. KT0246]|uniref:winged helix-turn-helix domain-containing protein n=1 Tax=Shewanella sp. KT0246 TaxID=2815912 RepID=UPI001BBF70E4|nr:crosslink repair DNA glycosylase YcaQ family protein [Shewanella sp. KT0246]GIU50847.1 hypothetical protein TUM4249_13130 [Shewanella sp. KT0246]